MSYWAEDPYKIGMPTPDEIMAPMPPHVEVAYLQHLAAQVALDWGELASACGDDPVPKWITAAMGKLDTVVDDLGELLVYLDAQMPHTQTTVTFDDGEGGGFDVDAEIVPLTDGPAHGDTEQAAPNMPDPKWRCVDCDQDGTNPVDHEDTHGHWPRYA